MEGKVIIPCASDAQARQCGSLGSSWDVFEGGGGGRVRVDQRHTDTLCM